MTKLETIFAEWEKDSQISQTDISRESLRIPQLHSKYYRLLMSSKLTLKKTKIEFDELQLKRLNFYMGRGTAEEYRAEPFDLKVLKGDAEYYLNSDKELNKIKMNISMAEETCKFLEDILKMLHNRNFQIKNYIDHEKFLNGN